MKHLLYHILKNIENVFYKLSIIPFNAEKNNWNSWCTILSSSFFSTHFPIYNGLFTKFLISRVALEQWALDLTTCSGKMKFHKVIFSLVTEIVYVLQQNKSTIPLIRKLRFSTNSKVLKLAILKLLIFWNFSIRVSKSIHTPKPKSKLLKI